jgi:Methyltransferase domain
MRFFSHRYPVMMPEIDVDALIVLAREIKPAGIAVEIGSRLGGSAKIIAEHAPQLYRLYCFEYEWQDKDGFDGNFGMTDTAMDEMATYHNVDRTQSCYQYAKALLATHDNVQLMPMGSPYDVSWWWSDPVDFVFEDSSHANPQLHDNIEFWWEHLTSGGIMSGHDYGNRTWPDVAYEVNNFADKRGVKLRTRGSIWWIYKP